MAEETRTETYFVLSDTHGDASLAEAVFRQLPEPEKINKIIHLGDHQRDGYLLGERVEREVLAVRGNMDGANSWDDFLVLDTAWGKLFLTHGHTEYAKRGPEILLSKAYEKGYRAVLYGHTHKAQFEEVGGICLLNPGSLTRPLGGAPGSYALLTVGPERFEAAIYYLQQAGPASTEKGRRPRGRLYGLLNNSDRF
ncbi:MAG: metallophosphoesterase [Bacillota bacterium]|nr:metallophosphoesterase [Bacillota bacterium]